MHGLFNGGEEMISRDNHTRRVEVIETSRLLLRRPVLTDKDILSSILLDEQAQRFLGGVLSPDDAEARITALLQTWEDQKGSAWAVCEQGKDTPCGTCALDMFEEEIEISYRFSPVVWGRGYATEAAAACLCYGFRDLGFTRIIGVTQEANRGSQHVLEKLGMKHVRNLWKWEAPQRYYEITSLEWFTQQEK